MPALKAEDLLEANEVLKESKLLTDVVSFTPSHDKVGNIGVRTFLDATFNKSTGRMYGLSGTPSGLRTLPDDGREMYRIINWHSGKQRLVSHWSYGAEIMVCADTIDRGYYIKRSIFSTRQQNDISHTLIVDSKSLFVKRSARYMKKMSIN